MQLNDLRPAVGSRKNRKRVGRGNSSGNGTFAGRGMNGQLSRSGGGKGAGFEGGQQPLAMRLPKLPGFTNHNRVEYAPVNVARLNALFADGETVDADTLVAKGVIKYNYIQLRFWVTVSFLRSLLLRSTRFPPPHRLRLRRPVERLRPSSE